MLTELHIKNAAIFERQTLSFGAGLTVLSGETGSGKSIILHAIEFLLGAKPKAHFLREGCDELEVQALFDLGALPVAVKNDLPEIAQEAQLAVSRSLNISGRGKIFINGRLSTNAVLTEVASKLVSICGQHQHVRLLDPKFHLDLLDGYAQTSALLAEYQQLYSRWRQLAAALESHNTVARTQAIRQAELEFLVEELTKVGVRPGLRAELDAQSRKLARAQDIVNGITAICDSLESEGGALEGLAQAGGRVGELCKYDPQLVAMQDRTRGLRAEIEALAEELRRYATKIELDPNALDAVQERLAEIARLERKYRATDEELCRMFESASEELKKLGEPLDRKKLEAEVQVLSGQLERVASVLTKKRYEAAKRLSRQVESELKELAMDATFGVLVEAIPFAEKGRDKVELMISANKGMKALPLRQVASGGELSRLTLVLKTILRERSGVNVLVFDEVDSGISGGVARAVGEKLKNLAANSQVICITHLPQVAGLADRHILVEKGGGKRVAAQARELDAEERVEEIARMLAGYEVTAAARASARELVASKES
jgi:DNA repair protein RecN (Recombination protein N)